MTNTEESPIVKLRSGLSIDKTALMHTGNLGKVIHRSDNGFTIAVFSGVTCKGVIKNPKRNAQYVLKGKFEYSIRHSDWQFVFDSFEEHVDAKTGMIEYLLREAPGIGPKIAVQLVNTFGEKLLERMREHPEEISGINGITEGKAKQLQEWAKSENNVAKFKERLYEIGLLPGQVARLLAAYGGEAENRIKANCFKLTEVSGFGFLTVAKIADLLAIPQDDPGRIKAAVMYAFEEMTGEGHTCLTVRKIVLETQKLIQCKQELIIEQIKFLLESRHLISEETRLGDIAKEEGILYP